MKKRAPGEAPAAEPAAEGSRREASRLLRIVFWGGAVAAVGVLILFLQSARPLSPPAPSVGPDRISAPSVPPSEIRIGVSIPTHWITSRLEEILPTRFGSLEERHAHPGLTGLQYAFEAEREGLEIEAGGEGLRLSTVIRYQGRGWFDSGFLGEVTGSCRTGSGNAPRARLVLSTPLVPDSAWTLRAPVRVEELEPLTPQDRCLLSGTPVDLTDWIMEAGRQGLERELNGGGRGVPDIPFEDQARQAWAALTEPIHLGGETWLQLGPESVAHAPIRAWGGPGASPREEPGAEGDLGTVLTLVATPVLHLAGEPPSIGDGMALPPLSTGDADPGFDARIQGYVGYEVLTGLAAREIVDREFSAGGRTVVVRGVEVAGTGDGRIFMAMSVDGSVQGRLFLTATPTVDEVAGVISLPDLEFHTETRSALTRAASWLLQGTFTELLREQAVWSVDELLGQAGLRVPLELQTAMGEEALLEGTLEEIRLTGITALSRRLVLVADTRGWLSLRIGLP